MGIKPVKPGPGQESVWDYPRPPRLEKFDGHIRIIFNDQDIAESVRAFRILETSHPPTFYIPERDFRPGVLEKVPGTTCCEWKGSAHYYDIVVGEKSAVKAAWGYATPNQRFASIKHHVSVYPGLMDSCFVNEEKVQAQEGDFYGGWITSMIVGPFKGGKGTGGW